MLFSVINKNLNWEILTKNLVTFKRWDGVKDKTFWYYWVYWQIRFNGARFVKKEGEVDTPIYTINYEVQYCLLLIIVELDLGCKMFHYADNTPHAIVAPTLVGC